MANNILQQLAQMQQAQQSQQAQRPVNQNADMLQQLLNFRKTFKGDPQQMVMRMLQTGQINNSQLQQAMEQAKQINKLLR